MVASHEVAPLVVAAVTLPVDRDHVIRQITLG